MALESLLLDDEEVQYCKVIQQLGQDLGFTDTAFSGYTEPSNPYAVPTAQVGGPTSPGSYPQPDTELGKMPTRMTSFTTPVDAMSASIDWDAFIDSMKSKLNVAANNTHQLQTADTLTGFGMSQASYAELMNTLLTDALTKAWKAVADDTVVSGDTYDNFILVAKNASEALSDALSDKTVAKMDENASALADQSEVLADNAIIEGRTRGIEQVGAMYTDPIIATAARTEISGLIESVDTNETVNTLAVLAELSSDLVTLVQAAFTNAASMATTVMASAPITNLVDAYEDEILETHMRSVNRISAGYSDINAVNSSAFAVAMVLKEDGFTKQVSKFRAEIKMKVFTDVMSLFVSTYVNSLNQDLATILSSIDKRIEISNQYISKKVDVFVQMFSEYMRSMIAGISELSQTQRTTMAAQGQVYQSLLVSQLDALRTTMTAHVNSFLNERMSQKGFRNSLLTQGVTEQQQQALNKLLLLKEAASLQTEIGRVSHGAYLEAWKLTENYVTEGRIWPWKKWQYLANVTAAAGSGVMVPDKPSAVQSTIAGILAGGLMGAEIGEKTKWGAGWGAAAGAVLGGIGGRYS